MPTFTGSRGRIFHDSWQPDGAVRGTVILLHGYGEHLGLYDALARRLVTDGLTVHAMDAVGHGRSDGERAVIPSWGEFADDARHLAEARPALPVLLVHCGADPIVPVTDAHAVAQTLPHATLRVFPGDLHDVLNEHDRDAVHDVVATFLGRVVAGRRTPLAS